MTDARLSELDTTAVNVRPMSATVKRSTPRCVAISVPLVPLAAALHSQLRRRDGCSTRTQPRHAAFGDLPAALRARGDGGARVAARPAPGARAGGGGADSG